MSQKNISFVTAPDNKACYCKLCVVDKEWFESLGDVNVRRGLEHPNEPVNRTIYEQAKREGKLLRAVDAFSSRQHDNGSIIGEILTEQEYGEHYCFLEKGVSAQGSIFKDPVAFNKKQGICYIPENDFFEGGYNYEEFLQIADGNEKIADFLFNMVDWQSPWTLKDELFAEGELDYCPSCGKIYLSYEKEMCEECKLKNMYDTLTFYEREYENSPSDSIAKKIVHCRKQISALESI